MWTSLCMACKFRLMQGGKQVLYSGRWRMGKVAFVFEKIADMSVIDFARESQPAVVTEG